MRVDLHEPSVSMVHDFEFFVCIVNSLLEIKQNKELFSSIILIHIIFNDGGRVVRDTSSLASALVVRQALPGEAETSSKSRKKGLQTCQSFSSMSKASVTEENPQRGLK